MAFFPNSYTVFDEEIPDVIFIIRPDSIHRFKSYIFTFLVHMYLYLISVKLYMETMHLSNALQVNDSTIFKYIHSMGNGNHGSTL